MGAGFKWQRREAKGANGKEGCLERKGKGKGKERGG